MALRGKLLLKTLLQSKRTKRLLSFTHTTQQVWRVHCRAVVSCLFSPSYLLKVCCLHACYEHDALWCDVIFCQLMSCWTWFSCTTHHATDTVQLNSAAWVVLTRKLEMPVHGKLVKKTTPSPNNHVSFSVFQNICTHTHTHTVWVSMFNGDFPLTFIQIIKHSSGNRQTQDRFSQIIS